MPNFKNYNRTEVNKLISAYLLDCIPTTAEFQQEYSVTLTSDTDRINYVMSDFERVANYPNNLRTIPNIQDRLADWLQGLPGMLNVEYRNYAIIELAKLWGAIPDNATEAQELNITNNWFSYMAFKFLQLHRKLNTPAKIAIRKTEDVYNVLGNYGQGYEIVTSESSLSEAKARLKEYRENELGTAFKIKKTREKIQ